MSTALTIALVALALSACISYAASQWGVWRVYLGAAALTTLLALLRWLTPRANSQQPTTPQEAPSGHGEATKPSALPLPPTEAEDARTDAPSSPGAVFDADDFLRRSAAARRGGQ